MQIRPEAPDDRDAISAVLEAAFKGSDEACLVNELRDGDQLAASLVATIDAAVAGHIALSWLGSPPQALALAPLAVEPSKQGRGIGSALVRASIDRAREMNARMIFVVGDPAYYRRFGFSGPTAAPFPAPFAGPHFMALLLGDEIPAVAPVIYPEPFGTIE